MNIRDKFNLLFAKALADNEHYFIQREWQRRDLAIIRYQDNQTEPVALFEFKARHAWFIASNERGKNNGESRLRKNILRGLWSEKWCIAGYLQTSSLF